MNKEEVFFRKQLRRLRIIATETGRVYQIEQMMFSRWPESQAQAKLGGPSYKAAAILVTNELLISGKLKIEDWKYNPDTGLPATREGIVESLYQRHEKLLRKEFDPLEIYPQVIMPVVKYMLEVVECIMVEQGYRLPRWGRPEWLKETHQVASLRHYD